MKILIAGGAGFIGSNFARYALGRWNDATVVVLDALTYAGRRANLEDLESHERFKFVHGDITDVNTVQQTMDGCSHVVNFAAETHVDRSILDSRVFIHSNVEGTRVLLDVARALGVHRYLQVSTDEVYGELQPGERSTEDSALRPRSPYSASKAAGDLLVNAYATTYGLPTLITRGANTYGPYQYPEKLIPLFVTNALSALPLPVYGDGQQLRDWLYVNDHCSGIATVLQDGEVGSTYNIGYGQERANLEIIERIIDLVGCSRDLIRHVPDRLGHDRLYALDTARLHDLGWRPEVTLDQGLQDTVKWYREHAEWWKAIKDEGYDRYYRQQYEAKLSESVQ